MRPRPPRLLPLRRASSRASPPNRPIVVSCRRRCGGGGCDGDGIPPRRVGRRRRGHAASVEAEDDQRYYRRGAEDGATETVRDRDAATRWFVRRDRRRRRRCRRLSLWRYVGTIVSSEISSYSRERVWYLQRTIIDLTPRCFAIFVTCHA